MVQLQRTNSRMVGGWLLLGLLMALGALFATSFATPAHAHHNRANGDAKGTTGGW